MGTRTETSYSISQKTETGTSAQPGFNGSCFFWEFSYFLTLFKDINTVALLHSVS